MTVPFYTKTTLTIVMGNTNNTNDAIDRILAAGLASDLEAELVQHASPFCC